jgi:hypothetical protein
MLGFPLGILSAAGAAVGFQSDYELISTTVLGGTATSVTFSSLATYASTYKHLQIRTAARSDNASTTIAMDLVMNADTAANYALHGLEGNGTSVGSYAQGDASAAFLVPVPANSFTASAFGASITDILDAYSTTKNKTIRTLGGHTSSIQLTSGHRRSTDSTTSLEVKSRTGSFIAGSRFSLYGIKG